MGIEAGEGGGIGEVVKILCCGGKEEEEMTRFNIYSFTNKQLHAAATIIQSTVIAAFQVVVEKKSAS